MDLYALDANRNREHLVDSFESAIWTERYAEIGELQVTMPPSPLHREVFVEGRWVIQNGSYRVMVIETVDDSTDADGGTKLKCSGRSLEAITMDRLAALTMAQVQANTRWTLTGTPAEILSKVFEAMCVDGILDYRDVIPGITMDPFPYLPAGTNIGSPEELTIELEVKTLYETLRDLCTTHGLGFALLLDPETGRVHFQVVLGSVRTSGQTLVNPVIFSPELDNLSQPSILSSSAKVKNVCIVVSDYGSAVVYAEGDSMNLSGFDRRVLLVRTSDIKEADTNKIALLTKIGRDELAKHRRIVAFDGEVPQSGHRYGIDYFMGDILEMRKREAGTNYMKVTEQIFIHDTEGERSYPTLSLEGFIAPGTWHAMPPTIAWDDMDTDVNWPDM